MKKLLLLLAVAFSMTAVAADFIPAAQSLQLGKKRHTLNIKSRKLAPSKAPAATEITGTYIGAAVTEDPVNSASTVSIETSTEGVTVTGAFLGLPDVTVMATYTNGTLTIPAGQQIYNHRTYGPAALYAGDENNLYDLVLTLQEDGSFALDPSLEVMMLLTTGNYAGYSLGDTYGKYGLHPVNGTIEFQAWSNMTTPADPDKESYPSSVKLDHDNEGNVTGGAVYGFDSMTWLPFTVEGNNVQFSNDKVYYYSSSYGLAFATDLDDNGRFDANVGPTGTIDAKGGTILMPQWSFMLPTTGSTPSYYVLNNIKKDCTITFPRDVTTSIESIQDKIVNTNKPAKVLRNGNLVIERNGNLYNSAGAILK